MIIACINCTKHRRFGSVTIFCKYNPDIVVENPFDEIDCNKAGRIVYAKCENCLSSGYSGGQLCPCKE